LVGVQVRVYRRGFGFGVDGLGFKLGSGLGLGGSFRLLMNTGVNHRFGVLRVLLLESDPEHANSHGSQSGGNPIAYP